MKDQPDHPERVVFATIYPRDPTRRSETFVTAELIREYLEKPRGWQLEVVIASAHREALDAARAVMREFPDLPALFLHFETEYAGTRPEEIAYCKEQLPLRLAAYPGWDWLLFMDADVWTRIAAVDEWMARIGEKTAQRLIKIKYCLRNKLSSPAHTLGAYFHHRALLETIEYWKVIFPKNAMNRRIGAPDCLLHAYLENQGCEKIVPQRIWTLHFLNQRDANWYSSDRCARWPGARNAAGKLSSGAWNGEPPPFTSKPAPFLHFVPYSLAQNLADSYNAAVQDSDRSIEWILITDADVMFLTPRYGHLIAQVIADHPEAGLITCVTNRIGAASQRAKDIPEREGDLLTLRNAAVARAEKYGATVSKIAPPCSGFFLLFRRSVWQTVGGFKGRGLLGMDWRFSRDVAAAGFPILRMNGLLAVHFYRLDGANATWPAAASSARAGRTPQLNRTTILNKLAEARGYRTYLEIGVRNPLSNYLRICCPEKVGVEPNPTTDAPGMVRLKSDAFFLGNTRQFDLIFIDGDHDTDCAARDIANAVKSLAPGGAVVIHDALPPDETFTIRAHQRANRGAWTGGVWEAVLRTFSRSEHRCVIVEADWGVAIVDTKKTTIHPPMSELPDGPLDYAKYFPLLSRYRISPAEWLSGHAHLDGIERTP